MPGIHNVQDAIAYGLSLNADDECGDCAEIGAHYSLVRGPLTEEDIRESLVDSGFDDDPDAIAEWVGKSAIVEESDQGFVEYSLFDSVEAADDAWDVLMDEVRLAFGPAEEDITITDAGNRGWSVGIVDGKHLGYFTEWVDAEQAVAEWCKSNGVYPQCWMVSDHGNAEPIATPV